MVSWNVNGARAVHRKGFLDWFAAAQPDLLCLQEVRAELDQIHPTMAEPEGYHVVWNPSRVKKGYSGTALYAKREPRRVDLGLGDERFDGEGRTIVAEFDDFVVLNAYFPNGRSDLSRVEFKLEFCRLFLERCEEYRAEGKAVIFCGDLNTSHREIDLARPRENAGNTGFLPEERAWIDEVIETGYVDSFRALHPDAEDAYTWWAMRMRARERNVGWRLDYWFVAEELRDRIDEASIHAQVQGSDHCPVELVLQV
jgi:exodeoxyribonuclease-3